MAEILLLPAPKPAPSALSKKMVFLAVLFMFIGASTGLLGNFLLTGKAAANIFAQTQERTAEPELITLLRQQNTAVRTLVDGHHWETIQASELFSDQPVKGYAELIDQQKWRDFVDGIKAEVEKPSGYPHLVWEEDRGWYEQAEQQEVRIDPAGLDTAQADIMNGLLSLKDSVNLELKTQPGRELLSDAEKTQYQSMKDALHTLVDKPITLHIGESIKTLDLNADADFVTLGPGAAQPNEKKIRSWVNGLETEYYREPGTVTIAGKEEIRKGVFKAITTGEFQPGQQIDADKAYQQVMDSLKTTDHDITLAVEDIPVQVVSNLDHGSYDILAVGYSEYSTGNAPNRVHNIETGLGRINGVLVDPGQEISFNQMIGDVDNDFRMGWGIFGTVALPVLGGGLCQVSTTVYRALLNLGVPITMRQPHSWDLSYYQKGGYGLDATIFPEKGVDLKAVNDYQSQLFLYSYTKPDTQEAFVVVYGKSDGRKVTLKPEEDYVPKKGAKTIKWKQLIQLPDGQTKENEIESHYRA